MRVLIDTHVFIWWTSDFPRISPAVYQLLCNPKTQVFLSVVSIWEMQIKLSLGKIQFKSALPQVIEDEMKQNKIQLLSLDLSHIYDLNNLPHYHKDPFDRLLISQARSENLIIISIDEKFDGYDIERFW
ncbi:MAG: type II toxin-antitoxin system VapC family toxin [Sphaerospermopsis kisseleviana]|jgi:PIN domain nuclease of toxin-antitoxin system|uniref:type II toxin-antitoxin system VapC family toxin n=1 Tax=Sphaerospermopsis sp. LEGE 08334 TaxID=1828651 RepID=UPI00187FD10F|nr:type II toxin-antitoxin system VapC family toxin [Sphaerospermopsis sp. LEGE 08334]MBE9055753.1 type II toxin-antitoxin system VapC family toxin [Sphaerospermopsis sp. LEGE 08334]